MKHLLRVVAVLVVVIVIAAILLFAWASAGMNRNELRQASVMDLPGQGPAPAPRPVLKVMSWNIGFGGGLAGGPTDRHPAAEVRDNLAAIAAFIREQSPDIVFLQEVDRPSSRTGRIDQAEYLLKNSGLAHACFVSTWRNRYVPFPYFPFSSQIGGVHSGQMILSRYPIAECRRIPLPQPSENSWWYNRFFLNRAIQHAIIEAGPDGGLAIDAVNVHLEAFSRSNRVEQAGILADYVSELPAGRPLVMAGDFNALPPFAVQTRGFDDEDTDFTGDTTIDTIRGIRGMREVFIDDGHGWSEVAFHTFPAGRPTRRLDYVFYRGLNWSAGSVPRTARNSDHLPVTAEFRP